MGTKELQSKLQEEHYLEDGRNGNERVVWLLGGELPYAIQLKGRATYYSIGRQRFSSTHQTLLLRLTSGWRMARYIFTYSFVHKGFTEGCRSYLSIDSTALNGRWNGHLAAATTLDGHNWMYQLAFGFIDGEITANWEWFTTQLHKDIGDLPVQAICTEKIEKAIKNVFPRAEHKVYFRHLMQNFLKSLVGMFFSKMYPSAREYRVEVFQYFSTLLMRLVLMLWFGLRIMINCCG